MGCKFCIFRERINKKSESMDLDLVKKIIKKAKNEGYSSFGLTGGEACLNPYFYEIIETIVKEGLKFGVVSNGYEYDKLIPLLRHKEKLEYILFSLDSAKEEIHDKLRRKGSFNNVTKAIRYFSDKGINVKVQMCLNKWNMQEMENVARLARKKGAKGISYAATIPTRYNKEFILSDNEREECYKRLVLIEDKVGIKVSSSSALHIENVTNFCQALNLTHLGVQPNGDVVFCCNLMDKGIIGNILKEDFTSMKKKGQKITKILKSKREEMLYLRVSFPGFNSCHFCNCTLD